MELYTKQNNLMHLPSSLESIVHAFMIELDQKAY